MPNNLLEIRNKWFISKIKEIEASGMTQAEIAKLLSVKPQYLSPILRGTRNASEKFIAKFCERFDINLNDLYIQIGAPVRLMTDAEIERQDKEVSEGKWGVGEMDNKGCIVSIPKDDQTMAATAIRSNSGIPLIPLNAMAGYGTGEFQILEHECDHYVVPMFKNADFLISVHGDSMQPKYNSGDVVACKKLPLTDLFFQWNKVYVIDSAQGPLIKRVQKAPDNDHILLVSENKEYAPFELDKSQINAVALVVGVIRLE